MHSFPRLLSTLVVFAVLALAFLAMPTSASPTRVARPVRSARPLKHVTRAMLVEQATRTKGKRQAKASATPFPASDGGYTSTGNVPWAVFTNLDIDCRTNTFQSGRFQTQESCHQLCQSQSDCIATTWQSRNNGECYTCRNPISGYFPTTVNGYRGSVRGQTCAQVRQANPSTAGSSTYICNTQYRAA